MVGDEKEECCFLDLGIMTLPTFIISQFSIEYQVSGMPNEIIEYLVLKIGCFLSSI